MVSEGFGSPYFFSDDPQKAIDRLIMGVRAARQNIPLSGFILVISNIKGSSSSFHCYPENEAFKEAQELLNKVVAAKNVNYDIGVETEEMMQKKDLAF